MSSESPSHSLPALIKNLKSSRSIITAALNDYFPIWTNGFTDDFLGTPIAAQGPKISAQQASSHYGKHLDRIINHLFPTMAKAHMDEVIRAGLDTVKNLPWQKVALYLIKGQGGLKNKLGTVNAKLFGKPPAKTESPNDGTNYALAQRLWHLHAILQHLQLAISLDHLLGGRAIDQDLDQIVAMLCQQFNVLLKPSAFWHTTTAAACGNQTTVAYRAPDNCHAANNMIWPTALGWQDRYSIENPLQIADLLRYHSVWASELNTNLPRCLLIDHNNHSVEIPMNDRAIEMMRSFSQAANRNLDRGTSFNAGHNVRGRMWHPDPRMSGNELMLEIAGTRQKTLAAA